MADGKPLKDPYVSLRYTPYGDDDDPNDLAGQGMPGNPEAEPTTPSDTTADIPSVGYTPSIWSDWHRAPGGLEGAEAVSDFCYAHDGRSMADMDYQNLRRNHDLTMSHPLRTQYQIVPYMDENFQT